MPEIKSILVVNRLTHNTRHALMEGLSLARLFGAKLSVLRVYSDPVDMEAVNAPGLFIKGEEYKNYLSVREQYKEELDRAISQVVRDGFEIQQFITREEPVGEIMRIVHEQHIDLVVTLAHEEGRLEHLLFGGENHKLIRNLPCSILLVKHEPRSIGWPD